MFQEWGYGANNGPEKWVTNFPIAAGARQSPIDIVPIKASYDVGLKPLSLKYDPSTAFSIHKKGHNFHVIFADDNNSILKDGPVSGVYRLREFHFHWGPSDDKGSEHSVDGNKYPAELHLVHWNTKYLSFADAVNKPDGLAVVGVFLKIGAENVIIQRVLDACDDTNKTPLSNFNPATLLPNRLDYWTYDGSLTTPPLHESVTWIVCKEPISISSKQMEKFRRLLPSPEPKTGNFVVHNFRPTQPLKSRRVKASFK